MSDDVPVTLPASNWASMADMKEIAKAVARLRKEVSTVKADVSAISQRVTDRAK